MIRNICLILLLSAASLWAAPLTSSNVVVLDQGPASLRDGHLESNTSAFLFRERGFTAAGAYGADIGGFGAGAKVDSWMLHFDPLGSDMIIDPDGMLVSFTFETAILGIDIRSESLNAGDALFGNDGTEYRSGEELRGLETDNHDVLQIAADGRTILFDLKVWYANADEFRIFTAGDQELTPNPEPGTIVLFGSVLAGAYCWRRRRKVATS